MGLVETANNDIKDITSDLDGWGVDIKIVSPDLTELNFVGLHTKHRSGYDNDGNQVNTKNAHISVSEDIFINASYPYRNSAGEVDLKDHLVTVKDSTRIDIQYIIREWFQDETIGNIVCILGDYEQVVPITPNTPTGLTATLFGINIGDLAWTDKTNGTFDIYEIFRSENGGVSVLLDTTTNPNSYRDESNLDENEVKFYDYKVRAVKDGIPSLFSNEDGALTLFIPYLELDLDASNIDELTLDNLDVETVGDVSINEADFIQPTSAQRPLTDSATEPTEIAFNPANSENLFNELDIEKFTALIQGSVFNICDSNTGERIFFNMANSATENDRFRISVNASEKAQIETRIGGGALNRLQSTTVLTDRDTFEWKLVSGVKKCIINGIEDTVVVVLGSNNSDWMDAPTLDNMSLASILKLTPLYFDIIFRELIITSKPVSDSLSQSIFEQLQVKHNL